MASHRFGKPSNDIQNIKRDFTLKSDSLLQDIQRINTIYQQQPVRDCCKVCNSRLNSTPDFVSHSVSYSICLKCSHLNGMNDDTREFANILYAADNGSNYSANYLHDYSERLDSIYTPKVEFLLDRLGSANISIADYGCGAGHFVNAAHRKNLVARGYDISSDLLDLATQYFHNSCDSDSSHTTPPFYQVTDEEELIAAISDNTSDVTSLIGVLEHLRHPNHALNAFTQSSSKYLYLSLPLFSLTVFFEIAFPSIFPRHLSGGHTHLFTQESIAHLLNLHNLKVNSTWTFGADILDLKRSLQVSLLKQQASDRSISILNNILNPKTIDKLQLVLDKSNSSSEIHLLLERA